MRAGRIGAIIILLCSCAVAAVPQAASREELDAFGVAYDAPDPLQQIKACESFLGRYPKSAFIEKAWELEFSAFMLRGDTAAALRVGLRIIAIDSHEGEILAKLSVLAGSSTDSAERERAAEYASRALQEVTTMRRPKEMPRERYIEWKRETLARAHATLGQVALRRVDSEGAVRECQEATRLDPTPAEYWKLLGLGHLQLKQNGEAVRNFQEALLRSPGLPGANLLLGVAQFYSRDYKGSVASLAFAIASTPPPRDAYLYLMRDYVALDNLNLGLAERSADLFPHDAELLFETGEAALDHVRSLARQANDLGPRSREFQELEARKRGKALIAVPVSSLVAEYDHTAALLSRCFEDVLKDSSDSVYGHRVRGYVAESQNHVDEALAEYRAGEDHFAAGRLLAQNTRYEEAVTEFKAELSAHPNNHLALAQLSQLYVQIEKLDLARPILDRLLLLYPGDAYAWLDKGRIEQKSGRWQDAAASFKNALSIDPNLSQARYRLATVYRNLGSKTAAGNEMQIFSAESNKKP